MAVSPPQALLIAVHPWDIDGARRAGLQAAWIRRGARVYPSAMTEPTHQADDLSALARSLAAE